MDIDLFLNKFEKEIKEKKDGVNLEFQKDIEDKIAQIQENIGEKDITLLKEIYEAIKKFDQDLPNKFLGIENKSGLALQNLGEKYTNEFLTINKNNAKNLIGRINLKFDEINESMKIENFSKTLQSLKEIKNEFNLFPKTLINQKIQISNQIKEIEIEVYNNLEKYKIKETKRIKQDLQIIVQELKANLIKKDIKLIEKSINEIKMFLNNIPKVILSHFTQDKIKINKVLNVAEKYLLQCYQEEYNYRLKVINSLIEKFHANVIKKKVKTCVLIYNEVLIEFRNIPEVFLEEKIKLYNKINQLFSQLNSLLIKDNIEMFLESYNHSKKIEATREYLRHAKESKTINPKNLNLLKEEIKALPEKLYYEQKEISKDIESVEKRKEQKSISEDKSHLKIDYNQNSNLKKNVNLNMLKEIEIYFNRLKNSENEIEINKLYEKILFYLKLVKISKSKKIEILKKVKLMLKKKGINK